MEEEKKELTPEELETQKEFYLQKGQQEFRRFISDIAKYKNSHNLTLQAISDEIDNKISKLSVSRRNFFKAIKMEVWKKWIPEKKQLTPVNYENN